MSQHDDQARLRDMLDYAGQAIRAIEGRSRADLNSDDVLRLALERCVEVIGEAAAHVSDATRARMTSIPWHKIIGMRNRLVHGYGAIDHDILWDVVSVQLPALVLQIEEAITDN